MASIAPLTVLDTDARQPVRKDWRKAFGALRRLLRDADDTTQVFEIMRALNPPSTRKGYLRLIDHPAGARQAYERTELAGRLMDQDWLAGFAPGTVGAAYHHFVTSEGLSADGLAEVSKAGVDPALVDTPDPVAWYGRRVRDIHDLWHILTGYGRDPLGEACLVAFSYSQTRGLGWLVIALGAMSKGGRVPGARAAIRQGFRNGRNAAWLSAIDYEALMALPIEQARAVLKIAPPTAYQSVIRKVEAGEISLALI